MTSTSPGSSRSKGAANMSGYRRVGYLEQLYYVLKWWAKHLHKAKL